MKKITKLLAIGLAVFGALSFFGCDNAAGGGSVASVDVSGTINSAKSECTTGVTTSSFNEDLSGDWDMVRSGTGMGDYQEAVGVVTIEKSNGKYKIYCKPGTEAKMTMTFSTPYSAETKPYVESGFKNSYPDAKISWSNGDKTMTVVYTLTKKEGLNSESADNEYIASELIQAMFNLGSSMSFEKIYSNSSNTKFYASKTVSGQTTTFVYIKK